MPCLSGKLTLWQTVRFQLWTYLKNRTEIHGDPGLRKEGRVPLRLGLEGEAG